MTAPRLRRQPAAFTSGARTERPGMLRPLNSFRAVPLTLVTVVFEPEIPLLWLQARSIVAHVDRAMIASILVIDNTAAGLTIGQRRNIIRRYEDLASLVRIERASAFGAVASSSGWRAQQALKLLASRIIETDWYLLLDAKVHFIAPTGASAFFAADNRPKGGIHSYASHPLLNMLEVVLRYEGVDAATAESFTSTTTPFLVNTLTAQALVRDVGSRNVAGFAAEFESSSLLEFFLYTAWQLSHGRRVDEVATGDPVESPTIWPRHRSAAEIIDVLEFARRADTTSLAVHRTALARISTSACRAIADFWVEHSLFRSRTAARTFIRHYRLSYYPAMLRRKVRTCVELRRQL